MSSNSDIEPITANAIATKIKRSRHNVFLQINKLSIKPVVTLNGISYYNPEVAEKIASAMRAPNKSEPTAP